MVRGIKHPIVSSKQVLDLRASIHNRFDIEVIDAASGRVRQAARAFNVICDTAWDRIFALNNGSWRPANYFTNIHFGSGSGTPSASDTALFSQLGYKDASGYSTTDEIPSGLYYIQASITLQPEEYVGDTLTEVGLGYDATHIATHAMLEDMNGNPISITKTATDLIKIYGTVYVHFPAGGWYNGAITVCPREYASSRYTLLDALAGYSSFYGRFYRAKAGNRTGYGVNSNGTDDSDFSITLDKTNKKVILYNRIAAAEDNMPIRAILVHAYASSSGAHYVPQFWVTPGSWFTPSAITSEPVGTGDGVTTGFSTVFPVGTVGSVKVDGAEASGAVMRLGPADLTQLHWWMNACYKTSAGTPGYYNFGFNPGSNSSDAYSGLVNAGEKTKILENPFSAVPVEKVVVKYHGYNTNGKIFASDDMTNWTEAGSFYVTSGNPQEVTIPSALRGKRYWQFQNITTDARAFDFAFYGLADDQSHNIVFSAPPAAGAVIMADYIPACIAKDSNHVFDLTLELTFGEYQEV